MTSKQADGLLRSKLTTVTCAAPARNLRSMICSPLRRPLIVAPVSPDLEPDVLRPEVGRGPGRGRRQRHGGRDAGQQCLHA